MGEVADLWFHSMIALAHYGLTPADVIAELERREGTSGIEEKALRKAQAREREANATAPGGNHERHTDLHGDRSQDRSLKTVGWVSYILHLIVAIGAVLPGRWRRGAAARRAASSIWTSSDDALGTWQATTS